jgi:DNA-binding response OmpR family regulator
LDLRLPNLTGEALCRELKWSEEYKHIPVIMLTAKDTEADRIIGRVIGAEVYLTKPCDLDVLEEKIVSLAGKP